MFDDDLKGLVGKWAGSYRIGKAMLMLKWADPGGNAMLPH